MSGNANRNKRLIRIGTRGSRLALAQAKLVCQLLASTHGIPQDRMEVVPITTSGDREQGRPLHDIGGKGLFCKEIEALLSNGEIDLAVHSLKDMPAMQPEGLIIDCVIKRGDPRDALVSLKHMCIEEIPSGSLVGTSSTRRRAQLLHLNPAVRTTGLRGNVGTRLRKLKDGEVEATFLSLEGLNRLGLADWRAKPISPETFIPAPGQAAICVERRTDDRFAAGLLAVINDEPSKIQCTAERAFLREIGGDCTTPLGGLATVSGASLTLVGELLQLDGSFRARETESGDRTSPEDLGKRLAERISREYERIARN